MGNKYYLAIDLGASSGRHIVGYEENGEIKMKEVYRFKNAMETLNGSLIWNIESIYQNVLEGIKRAFEEFKEIQSLAIDTWGVDYVLMNGDKEIMPCYAYRDSRTEKTIPLVHEVIPFEELYKRTGIQFASFNTIYQLYADKICGRLDNATDFLNIPEYLSYKLTGVKKKEYTYATTTGMLDAKTLNFDKDIINKLGFNEKMFLTPEQPGTLVGKLKKDVAEFVGGQLEVVFCPSHDTASAVEGFPCEVDAPYVSSGTWSLLGVKSPVPHTDDKSRIADYSNEGGVGYIRFQKNIMGMWLVQSLMKELCPDTSFADIATNASKSDYSEVVNVNDKIFFAPESMKNAFDEYLKNHNKPLPKDTFDYFRCAYVSVAYGYKQAIEELEDVMGEKYDKIYIIGGGAKNDFLNSLIESICKVKVKAFPIEGTSLGNLKTQMKRK